MHWVLVVFVRKLYVAVGLQVHLHIGTLHVVVVGASSLKDERGVHHQRFEVVPLPLA